MTETVTSTDIRTQVLEIVAAVLEVDQAELTESSSFEEDFGADSLLVIEMFARFDRDLGIKVPETDMAEPDDLPTVYALVEKYGTTGA